MLIPFVKMQAQGNDFVILDMLDSGESKLNLEALSRDICDRRKGVGADGLALLFADETADARMVIFNSDGSRAAMCGSALRCCADMLYGMTGKKELQIATDSGIKTATVLSEEDGEKIEVNLGKPAIVQEYMQVDGLTGTLVDVGNLHYVTFWERLAGQELTYGAALEKDSAFSTEVNSEYVQILSSNEIRMTVWERGCGITQACGTGAVASVFTGFRKGKVDASVKVNMPGGAVQIKVLPTGECLLIGSVENVFTGMFLWKT